MADEENLKTCVFTKRTHRFGDGKVGLSNWGTMGSDGKNLGISVGSFSKTNPPGGVFGGMLRRFEEVLGSFREDEASLRKLRQAFTLNLILCRTHNGFAHGSTTCGRVVRLRSV